MSNVRAMFIAVATIAGLAGVAAADGGGRKGPPQQAFDACTNAKVDDPCSFKSREDHDVKGTCEIPRHAAVDSKALVCRPPHHRHDGSAH